MEFATLAIPIALVLIWTVLLIFVIRTSGNWMLKTALVIATAPLCFGVWSALDTYRGWAATGEVPKEFQVIWMEIREPNPSAGDQGAIYIWLRPYAPVEKTAPEQVLGYQQKQEEPRTYRLPYSRQLHERAAAALKRIAAGQPVIGTRGAEAGQEGQTGDPDRGSETGEPGRSNRYGRDSEQGQTGQGGGLSRETDIMFHDLPPPRMPEKNPPQ